MYIVTQVPVQRDYFAHGQKRVGVGILLSCGPPVPWSKAVDPFKVRKELTSFLQEAYWYVNVRGDP
jgi:hypothetical protein